MRKLEEITEELLTERAAAIGWRRDPRGPVTTDSGDVMIAWTSHQTDLGMTEVLDTLDPEAVPEPRRQAQRATLIARFTGQCPVCHAAAQQFEGEDPEDLGLAQRVTTSQTDEAGEISGRSVAWVVHGRECPVAPWSLEVMEANEEP